MEWKDVNAVVLDLETTGLCKKTDRIIEIGALRIRKGQETESLSLLLDPGFPLSAECSRITGITDEMLAGQKRFSEIADKLEAFLGDDPLIGHSITGDFAFLKKAFVDCREKGYSFEKTGVDTLKLSRRFLPADEKKTLSAACAHFGLSFTPHRALSDARATFQLYQKLFETYEKKDPLAFVPVRLIFAVKKDAPVMEKQLRQMEQVFTERGIVLPPWVKNLSKSQASRLIDKVRAGDVSVLGSEE